MVGQNLQQVMISFIVPAHNEEACLPRTLRAIHDSARATGQPYEIIVVNDASTDRTAEIALEYNASVVSVNHRQIAATRNSGGRAANGERLFFIDADTTINAGTVAAALREMDKGAVGGGAPVWFDKGEVLPLYIRLVAVFGVAFAKIVGYTGGAFMFCTREAFRACGGFNERLYWAEEGDFILALKREGRFVVVWKPVLTSGRRFRTTNGLQALGVVGRAIFSPVKTFTRRASVEKIWYDSNRKHDDRMPNSLSARISNGIAFLIFLVLVTGPVWFFIPWSATPISTPFGKVRFAIGIFLCHVGLLFWPFGLIVLVNLLRQKRWTSVIHSTATIAVCAWQGWDCTQGVISVWTRFGYWVAHF
jgi:glycosyltransferase involved in cell wall biosynthesis